MPPQHRIPATRPSFGPNETEAVLEAIDNEIDDASAYNEADDGPEGPEQAVVDYVEALKRARDAIHAPVPAFTILIDNYDEAGRKRYSTIGQWATHVDAYAALPAIVRSMIEDPEGTAEGDASHTPEELESEVQRIAETGDADAFGFYVRIVPWSTAD